METKELRITIPENHEIYWQESAKQEKIVFKKKDNKPRSWEEYLSKNKHSDKLWYIDPAYKSNNGICCTESNLKDFDLSESECCVTAYLPSKELTEAFLAMMQLMSLRQEWVGNWKPDWKNACTKYCIYTDASYVTVHYNTTCARSLSFPTKEMATDFMYTFKNLLEVAKPLI